MKQSIINSDPEIMGGTPVFRGTRIPIQVLFDCIQFDSLEEFFDGYPQISRKMVDEVFSILREKFLTKPRKLHDENLTRRTSSTATESILEK